MCLRTEDGRAVRDLLDLVGDKWSLLIIATLRSGRLRFSALQRYIPGVSQRMLTLEAPRPRT
ncbi:winged helix-turn-helix transcriptional regulator [Streptomyces avermitilis]|uniref:winged helix-turn-helix transcriptional regulator n=1 Tax=Streptomyces avermitilis TaxID=33903 RepID=UPI0033F3FBB1